MFNYCPPFVVSPPKPKRNSNLAQITIQLETWLWFPKRKILHKAPRRRGGTSPLHSPAHSLPAGAPSQLLSAQHEAASAFLRGLAHAALGSLPPSPSQLSDVLQFPNQTLLLHSSFPDCDSSNLDQILLSTVIAPVLSIHSIHLSF